MALPNRLQVSNENADSSAFILAYLIPILLIGCVWGATVAGYVNFWAFLPLVMVYFIAPVINVCVEYYRRAYPAPKLKLFAWHDRYNLVIILAYPVQLYSLLISIEFFTSGQLNSVGQMGWILSTGLCSALFAINVAHELIHARATFLRQLGCALLSTVCFAVFKSVHLRIHHRYAGTEHDFQSAPRGKNIYKFWYEALRGHVLHAMNQYHDTGKCARAKRVRRELLCWYGVSAAMLIAAFIFWGVDGAVFFLLQSLVAILKLEWVNYLQHYGLSQRSATEEGTAHFAPCDAWSQDYVFTNSVLLNLMRHSDHHANPGRPYYSLRYHDESPHYPYDYSIMFLLTLVPRLFRRIVHPRLNEVGPTAVPRYNEKDIRWSF